MKSHFCIGAETAKGAEKILRQTRRKRVKGIGERNREEKRKKFRGTKKERSLELQRKTEIKDRAKY